METGPAPLREMGKRILACTLKSLKTGLMEPGISLTAKSQQAAL
jgi:hypothetical protein